MSSEAIVDARRGAGSGIAFVVTGPSGAGKTTVIERVLQRLPRLVFSVSHTTRARRRDEIDGVDYVFVEEETFDHLIRDGAFIEHTVYAGARYGTTREQLFAAFAAGNDVLLNVEVQGAANLRAEGLEDHPIILIFLATSTLDLLARRLRTRGTDGEDGIARRIETARTELTHLAAFDYLVVNDDDRLDRAADELATIIEAERLRLP